MGKYYSDKIHANDAAMFARLQADSMGMEYGMGDKIDASYLYDQIKPVTVTNRGGVLAPALAVAGGSYLLGEDQALGSMNNGMKNAYDGMQNIYGKTLDNGMNSVIDFFNPKPDMMANGPLSRGSRTSHVMPDGTVMPGAKHGGSYELPSGGSYDANLPSNDYMGKEFLRGISAKASPKLAIQDDAYFARMNGSGDDRDRASLANTVDYSQWTEENPVNIHYNSKGEPVEIYGFEGGIPDISMLDYGIDVPGGMGVTPNATRTVFNSPYPGQLNKERIQREVVYPEKKKKWYEE